MLKVVWVDRNRFDIEDYIKSFQLSDLVKPVVFENFMNAMTYLKEEKNNVDLIISNYSTLSWATFGAHSTGQDLKSGFDFFDELTRLKMMMPFIMYTSMTSFPDFQNRINGYIEKSNFTLVEKYTQQNLKQEIEIITKLPQKACM